MKLLPPLPRIGLLAAVRRTELRIERMKGRAGVCPACGELMRLDTDGAETHCPNQSCEWGPSGATGRTSPQLRRDLQQNQSVNRSIVVRKHRSLASGIVLSMCSVMIAGSLWAMHTRSGSTMVIVLVLPFLMLPLAVKSWLDAWRLDNGYRGMPLARAIRGLIAQCIGAGQGSAGRKE
ncbi:hypothetical protein [Xanthobacter aminoxidans]|jgi:hypothetical protein|uniref:Uncharacterized protein n=1 Tax=Xanthobacter aminoxidans TaxID=186280 RepID=A0ABW6ZNS2_9HYPH